MRSTASGRDRARESGPKAQVMEKTEKGAKGVKEMEKEENHQEKAKPELHHLNTDPREAHGIPQGEAVGRGVRPQGTHQEEAVGKEEIPQKEREVLPPKQDKRVAHVGFT